MAVKWTPVAEEQLNDVLWFYTNRNGSSAYSIKLLGKITRKLQLVSKNPYSGMKTDEDGLRMVFVDNVKIFYSVHGRTIEVDHLRGARQNDD